MHRLLLLVMLVCAITPTMGQPSAEALTAEVTDNVATEYAECAAYFAIVQGAFASSGKPTESANFKAASDKAAEFSVPRRFVWNLTGPAKSAGRADARAVRPGQGWPLAATRRAWP